MARREETVLPARLEALPRTAAFAQAFCDINHVARDDALRLRLILEELFTNTVEHGHGGDCDAPIRLVLEMCGDAVKLLYEDCAPPYDPVAAQGATRPSLDGDIESRPVGGLGLHLVRELAAELRYAYEQSRNRVWLTLKTNSGGQG